MKDVQSLVKADFDRRVGDEFRLELGADHTLPIVLVSSDLLSAAGVPPSSTGGPAARAPFSLIFRSVGERRHAPQRIYTVRHAELGAIEIFLVPIGPDEGGMRYEAVFT